MRKTFIYFLSISFLLLTSGFQMMVAAAKEGKAMRISRMGLLAVALLGFLSPFGTVAGAQDAVAARATRVSLPPSQVKALSDWTYALAVQAANYGAPLVTMYNLRYNDTFGPSPKAAPNNIWRMPNISTPQLSEEAGYVTPNVNTIYGFGFLDLGPQPVILTLPDSKGLYYTVEVCDMWTNAFAYPAGAQNGYKGGKFALVGPEWKGTLPAGVQRIDSPTGWVLIQPRVHLKNQGDLATSRAVLDDITTQGLAQFLGQAPPPTPAYNYAVPVVTDRRQPASALNFTNPTQFWEILSAAMNENPPPASQIAALLPMFKPLGIELGKQWRPSSVDPITLAAMNRAATEIGPLLHSLPAGRFQGGWFVSPPTVGNFGTDYRTRAVAGRQGLTLNTPSEAIYIYGGTDSHGMLLSGANRYTVTFHQLPPFVAPGFWSVTMYDATNNYTVSNSINRYSLGSDNTLKTNADGTTTIYVQAANPGPARMQNWLPAPNGRFYLILRSYAPGPAMVEFLSDPRAYRLPDIDVVR